MAIKKKTQTFSHTERRFKKKQFSEHCLLPPTTSKEQAGFTIKITPLPVLQ